MFIFVALTADDLVRSVDPATAAKSRSCSPNLVSFDSKRGLLNFVTRCSGSSNSWYQRVVFPDWEILPPEAFEIQNWDQIQREYPEILEMDIKVGCNCPAALYQGTNYILTQLDAEEPTLQRYKNAPPMEGRPPNTRDPGLDHTLCKHLTAVLNRFF